MKKQTLIIVTLLLLLDCTSVIQAQTIRYVKPSIGSCEETRDSDLLLFESMQFDVNMLGYSWETACSNLQLMIDISEPGDEIWVAEGTYIPNYPANIPHEDFDVWERIMLMCSYENEPNNSFVLKDGVKIYGGFQGWEYHLSQRDWRNNVTILSGLLSGGIKTYHVVISVLCNENTVLDGFTIRDGEAFSESDMIEVNGIGIEHTCGGGIYNYRSQNVKFTNLIITANNALFNGGGIYEGSGSSSCIMNSIIHNNTAGFGAGVYCSFDYRRNKSSKTILNTVLICGNYAFYRGGGLYNAASQPTLVNITMSGNYCPNGYAGYSGIYNGNDPCANSFANILILNSIISANPDGESIFNEKNATVSYNYSYIDGIDGFGNLDDWGDNVYDYPFFIAPVYGLLAPNDNGDYHIQDDSFSERGNLDYYLDNNCSINISWDLNGDPVVNGQIIDWDLDGKPRVNGQIDIGVYEQQ